MKLLKFTAVGAVVIAAAFGSIYFTKDYVTKTAEREKTLAEIIMQNSAGEAFESQAQAVIDNSGGQVTEVTAITQATPAAATATVTKPTTTGTTVSEISESSAAATEKIVTEYKIGGLIDTANPPQPAKSITSLTPTERERLSAYLIEHYFLDGFIYAENEQNPELKAKKLAAAEMESASIQTVQLLMSAIDLSSPTQILSTDFGALSKKVEDIKKGFAANYGGKTFNDPQMQALYDGTIEYFGRLEAALGRFSQVQADYNNSSNALMAAALMTKAFSETLLPEVMNVLESSFDLVEASQPIFLENTTGHTILTRDEVRAIIGNPGYVV
ncbi:MAG: hypothetical protein LBL87_04060 [Ruminococcus sp.]|jgi:hypothetical protein|nr:hypothetical protein [Ruminococcus sp.]